MSIAIVSLCAGRRDANIGELPVAKPEWGTKRICHNCGARFYDLRRDPANCPACGTVAEPGRQARPKRGGVKAEAAVLAKVEEEKIEIEDVEEEVEVGEVVEEDADVVAEDEDLIEDVSDLGEDDDDIGEVIEHIDEDMEDKS
jgi:uncharacterized protein (TIGR02300 family)